MKATQLVFLSLGLSAAAGKLAAEEINLVANASFEEARGDAGAPSRWATSGNSSITQTLASDTGRDGNRCAKLVCTKFTAGGPDHHVMLCQVGQVGAHRGKSYRLTFWAKGSAIEEGAVEIGLSNTKSWESAGLSEAFLPRGTWERFEFQFRAKADVPAATSRLQFWFRSTGTLWLDDVSLVETSGSQQWLPVISAEGVKNLVPNSSFECGGANWGGFTWGLGGWSGNLYRLEGGVNDAAAHDGQHSVEISLGPQRQPVYWFDYYEPVRQPVLRVLVANRGWFRVQPNKRMTLSAWMRADAEGVAAKLAVNEAPNRLQHNTVIVGTAWRRYEFSFTPSQEYLFIAVGLDLEASQRAAATLRVDAVQLERGDRATDYEPRQVLESFIETAEEGNIFRDAAQSSLQVLAYNHSGEPGAAKGTLTVTDFFDRTVLEKAIDLAVSARSVHRTTVSNLSQGRRGFFRASWASANANQSLRCAVVEPAAADLADSPLGFNHAYPWEFLVRLARDAGVVWWRDWSAKWHTVEPERGRFDFQITDAQIRRVLELGCQVEVLLPFPSSAWSTSARPEDIDKAAAGSSYLRSRLPMAFAPKDSADFGKYAAEVVRRYRQEKPHGVTHFQILNEPVYTNYALPRQFGYTLADYLRLVETASRAMKSVDPQCRVVGGISANLRSNLTTEFVTQGGSQWLDVVDLHIYDSPRPVETYEEPFRSYAEALRSHGGAKPIWITEWGCYADDDPPSVPLAVGDETMNRCRWPSEAAAAEHIVKFTALSFAYGVRKIFFHAGTCGPINGSDAGGVLFEYGGTPRKMYPTVAVLTRMLGVPDACEKTIHRDGLRAYVFRTAGRSVAVAWRDGGPTKPVQIARPAIAYDIMGNELPRGEVQLGESPIYVVGANDL